MVVYTQGFDRPPVYDSIWKALEWISVFTNGNVL